jgi:hypothetical protein
MQTAPGNAPITSSWYGQGRAVDVARRLESLTALSPSPGPAGVITARPNDVTVTFVEGLKAPLPHPWQPCGLQARIGWDAVATGEQPDPDHPVYLVAFGTTADEAIIGLNLAAFPRIRIAGDRATASAVVTRWVLELLATHPTITVGLTADAWRGPWTTRVQPVAPGAVPEVDVLVCGAEATYADRAQIVTTATSPIIVDLGDDAAVTTTWTITCGADRHGEISRGPTAPPMSVTLIVPTAETLERCTQLLLDTPTPHENRADAPPASPRPDDDTDPTAEHDPIDFFTEPAPTASAAPAGPDDDQITPDQLEDGQNRWSTTQSATAAGSDQPADSAATPAIAPIWNRILGRVDLHPPHPDAEPGPRERRLNELTVFLQLHPWTSTDDIIRCIYSGAASDKTVTQQISLLRKRLGVLHAGGPKALPPMLDGEYHLDSAVRSDWMEFERLVEILVETTPTPHLIAAMALVTGPPLGGIPSKEWPFARDLRDELRDRVPAAAAVLARRHHDANNYAAAVEIAGKGLWYDNARQDLWQIALTSALQGRDKETFRALRGQYLNTIPGPERDSAVFDLTRQAG